MTLIFFLSEVVPIDKIYRSLECGHVTQALQGYSSRL